MATIIVSRNVLISMAGDVNEIFVGHTVVREVGGFPAWCKSISEGNMENPRRSQEGVSVIKVYNPPDPDDEEVGGELFEEPPQAIVIRATANANSRQAASVPLKIFAPHLTTPGLAPRPVSPFN